MESRAFWANQLIDLPFMGMEGDACKEGTKCPLKRDAKNNYKIKLPILKEYPAVSVPIFYICNFMQFNIIIYGLYVSTIFQRPFDVKFKLWNKDKIEENCCFVVQIKLIP